MTISGLDFNTPDTFVMSYLNKFGKVSANKVIYDRYKEGPFSGKYNGGRKYQVDFTESGLSMGTFHLIDGNRVKVFYPGNRKTCGRCHKTADNCKGEAMARDCENNGGVRIDLATHMKQLWGIIGFQPHEFNLETNNDTADAHIEDKVAFSPHLSRPEPTDSDLEKFDGLSLKNFPRNLPKKDIVNFLISKGLPEDFQSNSVALGKHGNVEISNLDATLCQTLLKSIHFSDTRQKFFGKPIYCRATRQLTPVKDNLTAPVEMLQKNNSRISTPKDSSESDNSDNYQTGYDEDHSGPKVQELNKCLAKSKFFRNMKALPGDDEGDDENEGSAEEFDWFDNLTSNGQAAQFLKDSDSPRSRTSTKKEAKNYSFWS